MIQFWKKTDKGGKKKPHEARCAPDRPAVHPHAEDV